MGVTIKDIAKSAGVSYSTVSKALRDSPLVKEPTKKRIIDIAGQLGYQPNAAARSLVSKKSHTIGIVWPTIERAAHAALITSLNQRLEQLSYTTLISINEMEFAINTFNRYQVDAILAFDDGENIHNYQSTVPIVSYGIANSASVYPTVDANRRKAIQTAVEYLGSAGHQKIIYIGDMLGEDRLQQEKTTGFKQAMTGLYPADDVSSRLIQVAGLEQYDGYAAAREVFEAQELPTAIVSGSHDLTRGILRAVHEKGLSIPNDISIISYDNLPESDDMEVPLSTVGVPLAAISDKLADVLMATIQQENTDTAIYLEPELKISGSSRKLDDSAVSRGEAYHG
ncbi:LacI family DNA-binding transcriptional regulator [Sediminibacillus albus]|uniref:LacI family transcriptional regulator n=1 Tax=Sediminibacillus albus TaxID=407036 RepID=A0A1G8WJ76_9BACI|nr:LacI family DNA-binding transcriptional regulator [Sediminibacillus albus]SDJ77705.1 LacI family transcriptional regulator [Sediminibacillus albus]